MKRNEVTEIKILIERLNSVHTTPSKLTIIRTLSTLYENSLFALVSVDGDYFAADSNPNDGRGVVFTFNTNDAIGVLVKSVAYEDETLIFKEKSRISTAARLGQRIADRDIFDVGVFGYKAMGYIDPDEKTVVWRKNGRELRITDIKKISIKPIKELNPEELFLLLPLDPEHKKSFSELIFEDLYKKQTYILVIKTK